MRSVYKILSFAALLLTVVPSFLVLSGNLGNDTNKWLMLAGFVLWFLSSPNWIGRQSDTSNKA